MSLLILGGGIAGLAAAIHVAAQREVGRSAQRVILIEREPQLFQHSSSRNAAIFRPLENDPALVQLAARNRELLLELGAGLLQPSGLCLVAAERDSLASLLTTADANQLRYHELSGPGLWARAPWLNNGRAQHGIFLEDGGVMDISGLAALLGERAQQLGVEVVTGQEATLVLEGSEVRAVQLSSGARYEASSVVIAAGAWARDLGLSCERDLPLTCYRRHLIELLPSVEVDPMHPVCWDVETGVYFRPSGNLVLACPGDDTPHPAVAPNVDPAAIAQLLAALPSAAPVLAKATVKRSWACLRTRTSDRAMVIGQDPLLRGLFWFAGLGGQGMSVGLAAAELLAALIAGRPHPLAERFAVDRFASN